MNVRVLLMAHLIAGSAVAQAFVENQMPLSNGPEMVLPFSVPSIGAPLGTWPPDIHGDLFWKIIPGEVLNCASGSLELNGILGQLRDYDPATPPVRFDLVVGPAIDSALGTGLYPGNIEPLFLSAGLTSEVFVPGGPLNPFVAPFCPWDELIYWQDVEPEITIPCNGAPVAVTWFVPGGMTTTGGSCGTGNYVNHAYVSVDETQADWLGTGYSAYGGYQIGGAIPFHQPLGVNESFHLGFTFVEKVLNVYADSGIGVGPESHEFFHGGALNALHLDVSTGGASIGVQMFSKESHWAGGPHIYVAAASPARVPLPGIPLFGAGLLLNLSLTIPATYSVWNGPPTLFGWYKSPMLAVPPGAAGLKFFIQGMVLNTACLCDDAAPFVHTNMVEVSFY